MLVWPITHTAKLFIASKYYLIAITIDSVPDLHQHSLPRAPLLAAFGQSPEDFRHVRASISSLLSNVWSGRGRRRGQKVNAECWDIAVGKHSIYFYKKVSFCSLTSPPPSFWLVCLQLEEERHQPRPNQLRRLASYVFSSSTLETEQYPHGGGSFIQRSRSAESSPAHVTAATASARRRHAGTLPMPGSPRSRHSVLNASRTQLQQMLAKLMNKNSSWEDGETDWEHTQYTIHIHKHTYAGLVKPFLHHGAVFGSLTPPLLTDT